MANFKEDVILHHPIDTVFDFFTVSQNLVRALPDEANAQLLDGPSHLETGSDYEMQFLVMGMKQKIRMKVIDCQKPSILVDEQVAGPFKSWVQTHQFEPVENDRTKLIYQVEFQPPGGMLAFMVTTDKILKYLRTSTLYRLSKIKDLLDSETS